MKPTEAEIENLLRAAPQPRPPAGLKDRLRQQLPHPAMKTNLEFPQSLPAGGPRPTRDWLANWWPALTAAGFALAGLVVLATQQTVLNELRRQVEELKRELAAPAPDSPPPAAGSPAGTAGVVVPNSREDLERLRGLERALAGEVAALEAMRTENEQLRAQALTRSGLAPEEVQPMLDARAKARSIACVNNLKQLGLAARIWATDNGDILPSDFLTMSNEIVSPKILVCPEDAGRQPAANWSVFTPAHVSYEFLAPSASETEPMRVVFRCPIHGHVCLMDGSVQSSVAREHPERLVVLAGKLYYGNPPPPAPSTPGVPPTQPPTITPEIMWRYGLLPTNVPAAPQSVGPESSPAP